VRSRPSGSCLHQEVVVLLVVLAAVVEAVALPRRSVVMRRLRQEATAVRGARREQTEVMPRHRQRQPASQDRVVSAALAEEVGA